MFNFLNNLKEVTNLPVISTFNEYKYVNLHGKAIYVQGYKDILSFEDNQIVLKLKEGELKIFGKNLNIKELNLNSITIAGRVFKVEEVGVNNV